jgi:fibronectin-binding autotransporter adhesin
MADRYWVGGSGNWDATSTANWSTSSGGAAGASAPTSADNVIFDAASNTGTNPFTVTVTGTSSAPAVCNDFSTGGAGGALDGAMTLTMGATARLDLYGSMTLPASNFTWTAISGAALNFRATTTGKTITTNGVSMSATTFTFDGVGGGWTLGSALTISGSGILFTNGSFDSGNYNISCGGITSNNTNIRSIVLGSSAVTFTGTAAVTLTTTTNLTWNAGTSTINCTGTSPTFAGGGLTFYNVIFASGGNGQTTITGANTFNDLSQTSRSATGRRIVQLNDNQTISGTLTLGASNTSIRRIFVVSNVIGTQRTITLNGTLATLADVDFRDIATAGTVGTWTGTRIGNGLNNSGITFDAPKNVYRVGTGNWSATQWSLSSGGSVNANNFPLAQDTAIFDTGTVTGTHTFDQAWLVGTLDCSALNVAVTFATSNLSPTFFKNLILDSDVTLTGTANLLFQGQGTTQTITSAGVSIPQSIIIESPSGTVQLLDNTTTTGAVTLTAGTLDLNDFDLTCFSFSSNNSNTRSIDFGTGEINITGNNGTVWTTATSTNFTYAGTPTVNATYSGSTGTRVINFNGISGATESNVLNLNVTAGSDIISIQNCFKNINLTGFSGTVLAQTTNRIIYGNLTIPNTVTFSATTFANIFSATSGTQQITTNGVTLDFPITIDGVGGTVRLEDNLTVPIGKTFTLTNGTLNINGKVLSVGNFSTSNSNARTIAFGTNGELTVLGVGTTAFNAGTSTNLTITGTNAKINMSGATAKTFAGGGFTYPLTLVQSGLGDLTLTGANTFTNMTNTVQPCTIIFPASTTTSFSNFNINGTAGNLVSLRSSTPGTRCVLAKV